MLACARNADMHITFSNHKNVSRVSSQEISMIHMIHKEYSLLLFLFIFELIGIYSL